MKRFGNSVAVQELWQEWAPYPGMEGYCRLRWHRDTAEGSDILLAKEDLRLPHLRLCFGRSMLAHRVTDRRIAGQETAPVELLARGRIGFFQVAESRYFKEFEHETAGIVGPGSLIHFAFLGRDFIFDAIVSDLPRIEFVDWR